MLNMSINLELESEFDMKVLERYYRLNEIYEILDKILNKYLIDEYKMERRVKPQDLMDEIREVIYSDLKEKDLLRLLN